MSGIITKVIGEGAAGPTPRVAAVFGRHRVVVVMDEESGSMWATAERRSSDAMGAESWQPVHEDNRAQIDAAFRDAIEFLAKGGAS